MTGWDVSACLGAHTRMTDVKKGSEAACWGERLDEEVVNDIVDEYPCRLVVNREDHCSHNQRRVQDAAEGNDALSSIPSTSSPFVSLICPPCPESISRSERDTANSSEKDVHIEDVDVHRGEQHILHKAGDHVIGI